MSDKPLMQFFKQKVEFAPDGSEIFLFRFSATQASPRPQYTSTTDNIGTQKILLWDDGELFHFSKHTRGVMVLVDFNLIGSCLYDLCYIACSHAHSALFIILSLSYTVLILLIFFCCMLFFTSTCKG